MSFVSKVSVSLANQTLYPSVLVNKVEPFFFACNLIRTLESVCSIAAAYRIQHVRGSRELKDEEAEGNGRLPVEDKAKRSFSVTGISLLVLSFCNRGG